ncbi:MAG: hypothetical protein J6O04_07005 [Selenomonadaceae bacterium]|nr:hypothetical protein [Selenomonadaceae bacterium]
MRVASSLMMTRYKDQINAAYMNQAKMMEQSDGSKLHRPSDNSVAYSRYLNYQNRNTENLQYQDNVKAGISWMQTSDAAMVNMTDIYTTLKEKTVDAANDTNNDNDLITAIAKEVKAKLYEMVSLGNNQQGDRYLFAGQSDLTQPFQISTEDKDRGLTKNLDDPQSKFFKNPNDTKNLNADDTGSLTQFLQLNDADGNTYFVNTQNGRIYTEDFVQNGYKDKLKEGVEHVEEGDEYAILPFFDTDALNVAGYFEATGVKRIEGNVTVTASDGSGDTEKTYNYGDRIEMGWDDTAVATVPVYILDGDGNMRVVAKGNTVKLDASKWEEAYVGVPLNATTYQPGKVVSLGSTCTEATVKPAESFSAGTTHTLDTYTEAIADADVTYTASDGSTVTVTAGSIIPAGVTVNILTDNTHILVDPSKTTADCTAADIAALDVTGTLADTSIIASKPLMVKEGDAISVVTAGTEINGYLPLASGTELKVIEAIDGLDGLTATEINDLDFSGTYKDTILAADQPITVKTTMTLSDGSTATSYETIPAGRAITDTLPLSTHTDSSGATYTYEFKVGDYSESTFDAADGSATANLTVYTVPADATTDLTTYYHGTLVSSEMKTGEAVDFTDTTSVTLPTADVMIKNENGNARLVKAGNPIELLDGESEAIIIGKPQSRHHFDSFTTIKQPIVTYQGDARYISMVKLNGTVDQMADTINATGQDLNGSDIFDDKNSGNMTTLMSNGRICYVSSGTAMINNMFTVAAKLEHGDRKWMRTDGITIADKAHEVITTAQGTTAARQNVYDNVTQMLTKQNETITNDINDVSATDVAELAVRLMAAQTIYSMSLSVGSRILPPSLADYL